MNPEALSIESQENMRFFGSIDEVTRLHVIGWAADREGLDTSLSVAIFVNGKGRGQILANQFRPGLAEEIGIGGATGNYCFRFEFEEPLSAYERNEVAIEFVGQNGLILGTVVVEPIEWNRSANRDRPKAPILVSSIGRSGSTFLMAVLASHPEIVVAGDRPFEIEMICYYAYTLRSLISAGDHERSLRPDQVTAAANRYHLGFNPYLEPSYRINFKDPSLLERFRNGPLPRRLGDAFREVILDFYEAIARENEIGHPLFFAEKTLPEKEARTGARFLFGNLKEIVLVRDLRDVLCSFMSSAGTSFEATLQDVSSMAATLLEAKPSIEADNNTCVVRYEDLIGDPTCIDRIFKFLGLYPQSSVERSRIDQLFRVHATSATAAESVRRWRRDLTADQLEQCKIFDAFHEAFGYEGVASAARLSVEALGSRRDRTAIAVTETTPELRVFEGADALAIRETIPSSSPEVEISFGSDGNSEGHLRDGWATPESEFVWTSAPISILSFPAPAPAGDYVLRIIAGPFVVVDRLASQRLTIVVNGVVVGAAVVCERALIECDLPHSLFGEDQLVAFAFLLPDATRPCDVTGSADRRLLGFAFERLELIPRRDASSDSTGGAAGAERVPDYAASDMRPADEPGRQLTEASPPASQTLSPLVADTGDSDARSAETEVRPRPVPAAGVQPPPVEAGVDAGSRGSASPAAEAAALPREPEPMTEAPPAESEVKPNELLMRFESLGENCEFGLVQRRCGAEPLGLFRFASAPLPKLVKALEARFEGFGAPDNIAVKLSSNGREYMVADRQFGFLYHAWVLADEMRPEEIHEREARRLPLLIRKLTEDLSAGNKLLVVRGMERPLEAEQVARLLGVLRTYGPNTLFWVELADPDHAAGSVEWVSPDLLKGYIDRFAPGDDAHNLSLDCWFALCREAERSWRRRRQESGVERAQPATAVAAE